MAGGVGAMKMVEYVVCGDVVGVEGVQSTHRKLGRRATSWWWGLSTFIWMRVRITSGKLRLGSGTPENRCAPSRR